MKFTRSSSNGKTWSAMLHSDGEAHAISCEKLDLRENVLTEQFVVINRVPEAGSRSRSAFIAMTENRFVRASATSVCLSLAIFETCANVRSHHPRSKRTIDVVPRCSHAIFAFSSCHHRLSNNSRILVRPESWNLWRTKRMLHSLSHLHHHGDCVTI